jgi:hypothetical protein
MQEAAKPAASFALASTEAHPLTGATRRFELFRPKSKSITGTLKSSGTLAPMTNDPKKDGNGKPPETKEAPTGDPADKPGLIIDVVLPDKKSDPEKSDPERELGRKH